MSLGYLLKKYSVSVAFPSVFSVSFNVLTYLCKYEYCSNVKNDLNPFELEFAEALDKTSNTWHRNSSQSGYSIPLLDIGDTQNFYTDFLVWKDGLIFSLDTKGAHLLTDALRRKLFDIKEGRTTKILTRFISKGKYKTVKERYSTDGFTVWIFKDNQEVPIICDTIDEAVEQCLSE